jgi:hypothetical protein
MRSSAPLLLAVLFVFSVPALAGPSYRYDSGQTLTTIALDSQVNRSHTITVPAGRVLTIVGWYGDTGYCRTAISLPGGPVALDEAFLTVSPDVGSSSQYWGSFILAGPATLTLSLRQESYLYSLVLTYALTRARTATP